MKRLLARTKASSAHTRALRAFYFRAQKKRRTNDKPNLTSIYYHLFSWITISGDDTMKIVTLTFSSSIYLLSIYARLRAWFAILWKKLSLFAPRIIYLPSFFSCVHPILRFTNENGISIINISTLHAGRDCIMVRHLVKKVELISVFPTNCLSPQYFSCVHPFLRFTKLRSSVRGLSCVINCRCGCRKSVVEAFVDVCWHLNM